MDFVSETGRALETVADWRDRAGGGSPKAWAEGGGARELATAWMEGDAADRATALLDGVPALSGLVLERGVADPPDHDLLVHARSPAGALVIGVVATAGEPFDERLDAWVAHAQACGEGGEDADGHLDRLTDGLFGTTLAEDPLLATLRYQLLAAVAGALSAARDHEAANAVLLVHEFDTAWTDEAQQRRNGEDLEAFVSRALPGADRAGADDAWLAGPREIAGVNVYVAKLVTSTR
jgi:hypothetical protein